MDSWEARLVPDSILPEQLADTPFGGSRLQPEKRLQLAVLEDAVMTFHRWVGGDRPKARRLFAEVDAWFESSATDWPFAFETICDALNLDPAYIRRGLQRWRRHRDGASDRRLTFRRNANGVRHQVLLYLTALKRSA